MKGKRCKIFLLEYVAKCCKCCKINSKYILIIYQKAKFTKFVDCDNLPIPCFIENKTGLIISYLPNMTLGLIFGGVLS